MVEKGLCLNCFGRHLRRHCKKKFSCTASGCKRNLHTLLHELNEAIALRRRTLGPANTGLHTSSSTSAVFLVTEQQQNTTSLAKELQTGITEMFSGWVATTGRRVVHQIVPVFLYVPRRRLQTHVFLDEGSNASLTRSCQGTWIVRL